MAGDSAGPPFSRWDLDLYSDPDRRSRVHFSPHPHSGLSHSYFVLCMTGPGVARVLACRRAGSYVIHPQLPIFGRQGESDRDAEKAAIGSRTGQKITSTRYLDASAQKADAIYSGENRQMIRWVALTYASGSDSRI